MGWVNKPVRDKDGRKGVVIEDDNCGASRFLVIRFEDNKTHLFQFNNIGPDPVDRLGIEWEYNPGKWAKLAKPEEFGEDD